MSRYLVKRFAQSIVAVWGVITLVFIILHFSGDPVLLLVPDGASRETIAELRSQFGFDRPMIVQYSDYLMKLFRLDLGMSLIQNIKVSTIILARLPYTLYLTGVALVVAVGAGLPVGFISGICRGTLSERLLMPVILIGQSMPTFWSGILMIMLFAVKLNIMPSSGADEPASVVMPAICLGALSMATFARITRTSIIEELDKDQGPPPFIAIVKRRKIGADLEKMDEEKSVHCTESSVMDTEKRDDEQFS